MTPQIGLALFTLRRLELDLPAMIRVAAEHNYEVVELVHRMHEEFDPDEVNAAFEETGLSPVSVHLWLEELEADLDGLVDQYTAVGCDTFVVPYEPDTNLQTKVRVDALVERLTAVGTALEARDCHFVYHPNHWDMIPMLDGPWMGNVPSLRISDKFAQESYPMQQIRRVEDELIRHRNRWLDYLYIGLDVTEHNPIEKLAGTPFAYLAEQVGPDVMNFEIDATFFVQQGYDPAEVIDLYGDRIDRLHAKDVDTSLYRPGVWSRYVDPGLGDTDFQAFTDAAVRNDVSTILFEHGHTTDPRKSIELGYETLRSCLDNSLAEFGDDADAVDIEFDDAAEAEASD